MGMGMGMGTAKIPGMGTKWVWVQQIFLLHGENVFYSYGPPWGEIPAINTKLI